MVSAKSEFKPSADTLQDPSRIISKPGPPLQEGSDRLDKSPGFWVLMLPSAGIAL